MPVNTTPNPAPTAIDTPVAAAFNGSSWIQPVADRNDLTAESIGRGQLAPKLNALPTRSAFLPTVLPASDAISAAFFPAPMTVSPAFELVSPAASRRGSLTSQAFLAALPAVLIVSSAARTACLPTS